jgi:hypothetical protein
VVELELRLISLNDTTFARLYVTARSSNELQKVSNVAEGTKTSQT